LVLTFLWLKFEIRIELNLQERIFIDHCEWTGFFMSDVQPIFIKHHRRAILDELTVLSNDSAGNLSLMTGSDFHQAFALAQHVEEITIAHPSI
jgi:hypothetical protein